MKSAPPQRDASSPPTSNAIFADTMRIDESASAPSATCRACGGALRFSFDTVVLGDTPARFHHCSICDSLMALEPHWLERSYATILYPDPDSGALRRTLYVNR